MERRLYGCLLGTAVGDALGLPFEGLTRQRRQRLFGGVDGYRFLWGGYGMVSDDTDHACMTAQSLIASAGAPRDFLPDLARRMRWWGIALPAGIGMATLRSVGRLWTGISPTRSGVFSAGNGPAMRSPIIGAAWGHRPRRMRTLVKLSARLTHRDPRATFGALAVAAATSVSALADRVTADRYLDTLGSILVDPQAHSLRSRLETAAQSSDAIATWRFCRQQGMPTGVTGFIEDTVTAVIHSWLRHPDDFTGAVLEVIDCGGDTDTTAAIVGAIVGARVGAEGINETWRQQLLSWPHTTDWMAKLARRLAVVCCSRRPAAPPTSATTAVALRNLLFTTAVLAHGFRRLAPPY